MYLLLIYFLKFVIYINIYNYFIILYIKHNSIRNLFFYRFSFIYYSETINNLNILI
jgi:hypothetical protein